MKTFLKIILCLLLGSQAIAQTKKDNLFGTGIESYFPIGYYRYDFVFGFAVKAQNKLFMSKRWAFTTDAGADFLFLHNNGGAMVNVVILNGFEYYFRKDKRFRPFMGMQVGVDIIAIPYPDDTGCVTCIAPDGIFKIGGLYRLKKNVHLSFDVFSRFGYFKQTGAYLGVLFRTNKSKE